MKINQYALYRVDPHKPGKNIWHRSYSEVQKNRLQIRVENYRQQWVEPMLPDDSAMKIRNRNMDRLEVSDVLVLNRDGELTAFYVDTEYLRLIAGFLRLNTSGAVITENTSGYHITDHDGNWLTTDYIIIDGKQYFLLEHEEFRNNTPAVILDAYGTIMVDQVRNGFDEQAKQQIRDRLQSAQAAQTFQAVQTVQTSRAAQSAVLQKYFPFGGRMQHMEIWQKYLQNGEYLRSAESGGEANYDMIDGRVNNLPVPNPVKNDRVQRLPDRGKESSYAPLKGTASKNLAVFPLKEAVSWDFVAQSSAGNAGNEKNRQNQNPPPAKKKKKESVIKKLHQKQIAIAIRSGKPVPKYLDQTRERSK